MTRRQRLLVIDDSPAIQKLVAVMLSHLNIEVIEACDGSAGLKAAQQLKPDLVLLDVMLPDMDGFAICRAMKANVVTRDIPVIFLTGSETADDKVKAFDLGASDYVVKPFNQAELRARVGAALKNRSLLEMLEIQAKTDTLTGLPNRALFYQQLNQSLARSKANLAHTFAVLFLDFDRFKIINDSLGHKVGDLLLLQIADRFRHLLQSDGSICPPANTLLAARLGGDEFAVLVEGVREVGDALGLAERLQRRLSEPYMLDGHEVHSTVSIGLTTSAIGYDRADGVIRDADTAMYQAKAAGRARYVLFDQTMRERLQTRLRLENELHKAMARHELLLHYQPIVSLESGSLLGFEALVRWQHPERGMVLPSDFIPIAEETGLILPLGEWVLQQACRQMGDWQHQFSNAGPWSMSVNLSRKQLMQPDLMETVSRAIEGAAIDPRCIHIEITESTIMQDIGVVTSLLRKLKGLGIKLDMDDFGTGYSSLSCLHQFPLDGLKIDRSFVANMAGRNDYAAVVHAILTLACNLGIEVTAEGVENVDQLVQLQAMGCNRAQGYYFGRPLSQVAAEELIVLHRTKVRAA